MEEFTHNSVTYYAEQECQPYNIHQSLTTDGHHALVFVKHEDSCEYGFVYHKWNNNRNYYLCVVSLGDNLDMICDNYMEVMEEIEPDSEIELSGTKVGTVYKYYNKTWKPVVQSKKGEWKYVKSHKNNHIIRILTK